LSPETLPLTVHISMFAQATGYLKLLQEAVDKAWDLAVGREEYCDIDLMKRILKQTKTSNPVRKLLMYFPRLTFKDLTAEESAEKAKTKTKAENKGDTARRC
jgi:hypothetical protein